MVVVVSAMGRKGDPYATDTLLSLVNGNQAVIYQNENKIYLCHVGETISSVVFTNLLLENGIKAIALYWSTSRFLTNNDYTNAKIIEMKCDRLLKELE